MKNLNKVALAFALTVPMGSSTAYAEGLAEKQPSETEYITSTGQAVGNIATLYIAREIDYAQFQNISEPAEATTKAVRIGDATQLRELPPPPLEIPNFNNWVKIAECESGSDWYINSGNGFYGGLQFTQGSWRGSGGLQYAQRADLALPAEQMLIAEELLITQGWSAWPACTRSLGLR